MTRGLRADALAVLAAKRARQVLGERVANGVGMADPLALDDLHLVGQRERHRISGFMVWLRLGVSASS